VDVVFRLKVYGGVVAVNSAATGAGNSSSPLRDETGGSRWRWENGGWGSEVGRQLVLESVSFYYGKSLRITFVVVFVVV